MYMLIEIFIPFVYFLIKDKDKTNKDADKKKDKKKKKKQSKKKDVKKLASGKDSSSDFSSDSDSGSDTIKEKDNKKSNSAHSSRSATPIPAAMLDNLKRKQSGSPDLSQAKKLKLDNFNLVPVTSYIPGVRYVACYYKQLKFFSA